MNSDQLPAEQQDEAHRAAMGFLDAFVSKPDASKEDDPEGWDDFIVKRGLAYAAYLMGWRAAKESSCPR